MVSFEIITNFQNETQNLCTFKKNYFSKFDYKKTYDILGQLWIEYIKNFKTFHLKIPLEENMFFGEKKPQKRQVLNAK